MKQNTTINLFYLNKETTARIPRFISRKVRKMAKRRIFVHIKEKYSPISWKAISSATLDTECPFKTEIARLVEVGSSAWGAPIFVIPRKDGRI